MDTALITAVWAFLGIVVTTLGTIAVQAIRNNRDDPSGKTTNSVDGMPPALLEIAKDIGQLDQRADDSDHRFEVMDRRLGAIEQRLDHNDPSGGARD